MNNENTSSMTAADPCIPTKQYDSLVPEPPSLLYCIELTLNQHLNQLKARLLNLAEVAAVETRQCNALKGLIKDAVNQAYFTSLHDITAKLTSCGIGTNECHRPVSALRANSLADILVD